MADAIDAPALIPVTVAVCLAPRRVRELELQLPAGATVADALRACGVDGAQPTGAAPAAQALDCGIWGRKVALTQPLAPFDRVEVYRPLQVDPKRARRERFERQGKRGSGLFAKRTAKTAKD